MIRQEKYLGSLEDTEINVTVPDKVGVHSCHEDGVAIEGRLQLRQQTVVGQFLLGVGKPQLQLNQKSMVKCVEKKKKSQTVKKFFFPPVVEKKKDFNILLIRC